MLAPLLLRRGYKLRLLEHENHLIEIVAGKLLIIENLSFSETMQGIFPRESVMTITRENTLVSSPPENNINSAILQNSYHANSAENPMPIRHVTRVI